MKIAIYARVSTKDKGQDTDNQLIQLREFAAKQGWTIGHEYIDRESGGTDDRPEFQKMFQSAERRQFDLLLFWSLDRLSREGVLKTLQHLNRLTSCGVCYKSFTESYLDSCGIFKDVIISLMATLAQQEKIRIGERTRAGLARTVAKGTILGRPRLAVDAGKVTHLRTQGLSFRAIGRELGISEGSVRRLA